MMSERRIEICCDKCGKEIDYYNQRRNSAKLVLWNIGENRYNAGQRIDFCEECFAEFLKMYDKFIAGVNEDENI